MTSLHMARRQSTIDDTDPLSIHCEGEGLFKGETGKKIQFSVIGAPNHFGLSFNIDGPGVKPDVFLEADPADIDSDEEDKIRVTFVPLVPGEYTHTIKWRAKNISGSPFKCIVAGEKVDPTDDVAKVRIHGKAIELGKTLEVNEFLVDASEMKTVIGGLKVHIVGPKRCAAQLKIEDNENGTYRVRYKPTGPGTYTLTIKIADLHIPGSPYNIRVTDFLTT